MKLFMAALISILYSQAWAYNTHPVPVEFGKYNQLTTFGTVLDGKKNISLEVKIQDKEGQTPIVEIHARSHGSCSHKQTLISFSGYDNTTRTYTRIYEIQIERNPEENCAVVIYANKSQTLEQGARVSIL
jgi:hypothetical protein